MTRWRVPGGLEPGWACKDSRTGAGIQSTKKTAFNIPISGKRGVKETLDLPVLSISH